MIFKVFHLSYNYIWLNFDNMPIVLNNAMNYMQLTIIILTIITYITIRLKTKKNICFNCLRDVDVLEFLDSSS